MHFEDLGRLYKCTVVDNVRFGFVDYVFCVVNNPGYYAAAPFKWANCVTWSCASNLLETGAV